MKLNYKQQGTGQPILFLHGMLGSLDNFNALANQLANSYRTIQVDLRNHGLSGWSEVMDYRSMAEDIMQLCDELNLTSVIIIGHSMGGKVAMTLTHIAPYLISQIVILDIAPVNYRYDNNILIFNTLSDCISNHIIDKQQIAQKMQANGLTVPTIQFLLKSYKNNNWLFNFNVIHYHYQQLCGWKSSTPWLQPILFIRGNESNYITDEYHLEMLQQFPYMQIVSIKDAGHNVHTEKTAEVIMHLHQWLSH